MKEFACQAILFDLDGTLIDSIAAVDRAWARWARRHGLDPSTVVSQIHGRRAADSLRVLAPSPDIDLAVEEEWLTHVEANDTEGIVPIAGALDFVSAIPLGRWSIVTSGGSPVARARMNAVGLSATHAVFGEEVAHGKPAPDPYLFAAERLKFDPGQCLVFEDTLAGILSGKAAGMRVIAVAGRTPADDLGMADGIIQDYLALGLRIGKDGLVVQLVPKT